MLTLKVNPQINNLKLHIKELEKEYLKSQVSMRKKTTRNTAEINELEVRKKQKRAMKLRAGFF